MGKQENEPLRLIKDNYEKMVLTMDYNTLGNYEGIHVIHVLEWLLRK